MRPATGRDSILGGALDCVVLEGGRALVLKPSRAPSPESAELVADAFSRTAPVNYLADDGPKEARDAMDFVDALVDISFENGNSLARDWLRLFISKGQAALRGEV